MLDREDASTCRRSHAGSIFLQEARAQSEGTSLLNPTLDVTHGYEVGVGPKADWHAVCSAAGNKPPLGRQAGRGLGTTIASARLPTEVTP